MKSIDDVIKTFTDDERKAFERGLNDYTCAITKLENDPFYLAGYQYAERENQRLSFQYLNYP
jgi:hypothetical protein